MDTNIEISNINKHFNINAKKQLENDENELSNEVTFN